MTRRKTVVEVHMVEPTLADQERDFKAIGGNPRMDTHPLLVQRYQHLPRMNQLGDLDPANPAVRNPCPTADQSFPANTSPSPAAVPGPSSSTKPSSPAIMVPVSPVASKSASSQPRGQKRGRDYEIDMKSFSTPSRYPKTSSSLNDVSIGASGRPKVDQVFERIKENMRSRFDRRFVEFRTEHNQGFKAAVKLVKGDTKSPGVFHEYLKAMRGAGRGVNRFVPHEDTTSVLLARALDEIANKLQPGKKNESYFASRGRSCPSVNPSLNFAPGHSVEGPNDEWYNIKPDMVIWKNRCNNVIREKVDTRENQEAQDARDYNWGKFAAVGEIRKEKTSDMRTTGTTMQASLAQVMNYMGMLAYENPVTGQTCGVTVCCGYMRGVLNDSLSCSTTRLCDLGDPEHAEDIVAMIAFLIGPLQAVLSTYEIPTGAFAVESGEGKEKTLSRYEWVPDDEGVKWKILERRHDLHGRRTVAIHGKARKIEKGAPTESLVIKFTWLPRYLVHYEQLILLRLARAAKEAEESDNNPKLAEAMKTVKKEILEYRHRSIGMLADCERVTRESPARGGIEDGLTQSPPSRPLQLVMSGMCTVNPVGLRINTLSSLSWKQCLQIVSGCFASLWIAACSDIHYRDLNTGNILYVLLNEHSGEVVGYLIDYGNARVLDQRRIATRFDGATLQKIQEYFSDPIAHRIHAKSAVWFENNQIRLDDARSINHTFVSTHLAKVLRVEARWQTLVKDKSNKDRALKLDPTSKKAQRDAQRATELLEQVEQDLAQMSNHRYIDDLESVIYVHIHQIAELVGQVTKNRTHSIYDFDNASVKADAWSENLRYTIDTLLEPDAVWDDYLMLIIKEIKTARSELEAEPEVSARLTDGEHECFRRCLKLLEKAQADDQLSDKPVRRPQAKDKPV